MPALAKIEPSHAILTLVINLALLHRATLHLLNYYPRAAVAALLCYRQMLFIE